MSKSPRQEFPASAAREIKARAFDREAGVYRCEGADCGCVVSIKERPVEGARPAQVDHKRACWTQSADEVKDRPPLTKDDGWLICEICHKAKTRREAFERMRTNGAGKGYAEHLEAMEAKKMGIELEPKQVKMIGRGFPKESRKLKGRSFPKKEDRQSRLRGQHTY